ncbi:unnamed protein product [Toxocara canis]|uniref:Solute carrier family 23 member 2 n=1 Tax=Toxocara canis TaxID=6265 RepID=A0A183UJ91_TOXCA|nr:unnamed protein product [Toxocara canis]
MNVYIMQYVAEVAIGCTGGIATLFMASFAIVTDDSRHQMLPGSTSVPLRIGIASALQSIGIVIGSAIASIFTISPAISVKAHEDGYVKATAASFAVTFIAIFYAFVQSASFLVGQKVPFRVVRHNVHVLLNRKEYCPLIWNGSISDSHFEAGGFSFLAGAIAQGYRSFLPRMVAKEETARLFAAFSIVMVVSPILSALVFNNIFNATIDVWPGFAFLVGSVLQLIVFIGQIVVHCLMWPQWNSEREERLQRLNSNNGDNTDAPQSPLASDTDAAVIINRSISNTAIHSTSNSPEISNDVRRPLLV